MRLHENLKHILFDSFVFALFSEPLIGNTYMLVAVTIIYIFGFFSGNRVVCVNHLELIDRLVKTWKLLLEEKRASILVKIKQKLKMRKRPRGNLRLTLMI